MVEPEHPGTAILIYDGECPFCRRYADFAKLSQAFPRLEVISARESRPEVSAAWQAGIDLNRDMVLNVNGSWFAGEQAILKLAEAAQAKRRRNNLIRGLFGSGRFARGLYKVLVDGRLIFLRLAGRPPLSRP